MERSEKISEMFPCELKWLCVFDVSICLGLRMFGTKNNKTHRTHCVMEYTDSVCKDLINI